MTDPEHHEYVIHIVAGKKYVALYGFPLYRTDENEKRIKMCYLSRMSLSVVMSFLKLFKFIDQQI